MCTQILSNLSANNKPNKEFLIKNQIINELFYVLFETETHLEAIRNNKAPQNMSGQLLEEIQVKNYKTYSKCLLIKIFEHII